MTRRVIFVKTNMVETPLASMERLFQALGDATRLRILSLLAVGEVCVCHIHESLRISQPKASRHLAYLRRAGLVRTRRQGLWVYYQLAAPRDPVEDTISEAVIHALGHLDAVRRDAQRLQKKIGCRLPVSSATVTRGCCGDGARTPPC